VSISSFCGSRNLPAIHRSVSKLHPISPLEITVFGTPEHIRVQANQFDTIPCFWKLFRTGCVYVRLAPKDSRALVRVNQSCICILLLLLRQCQSSISFSPDCLYLYHSSQCRPHRRLRILWACCVLRVDSSGGTVTTFLKRIRKPFGIIVPWRK